MLEDLKRMLGLPLHEDEELDKKLDWILSTTRARLKVLLGGIDPRMTWIISSRRFRLFAITGLDQRGRNLTQ